MGKQWKIYHEIEQAGVIYFIRGNTQMQITDQNLIYFYSVSQQTLLPKLDNVMYNFVGLTNMIFGSRSRYCITYKLGLSSISI